MIDDTTPTGNPAPIPGEPAAAVRRGTYAGPVAGLPPQTGLTTDTAVFTESYAVIPRSVMRDIVTSYLPGWTGMRMWMLARPLSGFAETFSQYVVELAEGGGCDTPEADPEVQSALFVTAGEIDVTIAGARHRLGPGGFAYVPPGADWSVVNATPGNAGFHWFRKRWQPAPGVTPPDPIVAHEQDIPPSAMPDTEGAWATTRFVDPADLRHDMHITGTRDAARCSACAGAPARGGSITTASKRASSSGRSGRRARSRVSVVTRRSPCAPRQPASSASSGAASPSTA